MPQKYHSNFKVFGKRFSDLQKLICFAAKISKDGANFLEQWFDEKDFIKVKTSGTTSNPKTIFLSKRKMINAAKKQMLFLICLQIRKRFCVCPLISLQEK